MSYQSIFRPDLFRNRAILITGGGTGIGRAIAHELAALGAHVLLAARRAEPLQNTADEIRAAGGRASIFSVNIRQEDSIKTLFNTIEAEVGGIYGLVNNAGGQFPSPAAKISQKGWHAVVETNLTGTFMMCREAYLRGMQNTGGTIVNIVAEMWRGFPGMAHTGAARAGVVNLTQTLAVEWAQCGVRVNAVAPGIIEGNGFKHYEEAFLKSYLEPARQDIPLKRFGRESEVAAAVTFLLSPAAAYITGVTLNVDGASSLWRKTWAIPDHANAPSYDGFES
ncbi:MAG: SDR family oxidoreductase [Anaerolineae bacterium]|nr:SDR family oxidoreductase [Anaerolineae bacterium]